MDNMKHRRLQELDRSDFGIVEGEPDIRGWDVRNSTGQKIGEVEELILDARQKKVRYMVVDLDDNELKLDHRKVLLPIGLAELDKEEDEVLVSSVKADQLQHLPAYRPDLLDEKIEHQISEVLGRDTGNRHREKTAGSNPEEDTDFYQHEHFNDNNLYRNRMHEARLAQVKNENENGQNKETGRPQSRERNEYEQGLRLWEARSEGGVIESRDDSSTPERGFDEQQRTERIRTRRKMYEDRRSSHRSDRERQREEKGHYRQDNSISARIDREGLQDAGR